MKKARRVVVTGLDCIASLGLNAKETWSSLLKGTSGISLLDSPPELLTALQNFDLRLPVSKISQDWKAPPKYKTWSRSTQLALQCSFQAIKDSGLDFSDIQTRANTGVCFGTGLGAPEQILQAQNLVLSKGYKKLSPYFISRILHNTPTGIIMQENGLSGPNHSVSNSCSTGASAVVDGYYMIKNGDAEAVIVGAVDACLECPLVVFGFLQLGALAKLKPGQSPEQSSCPFDVNRAGFVLGEGCGVLVLEEREQALRRGARLYGELSGYGMASDGYHMTSPHPDAFGAVLAMQRALSKSQLSLAQIDYINAHGTSTALGDTAEILAISRLIQESKEPRVSPLALSSTKGSLGHLLGAAGIVEAVFCLLSLYYKVLPPTLNLKTLDPKLLHPSLDYVIGDPRSVPNLKTVLSNSFGFGGTNVSLVFSSAE